MHYETIEGTTHIYVDEGEDRAAVLRALVLASFNMARPFGLSRVGFATDFRLTDDHVGLFIEDTGDPNSGSRVVRMEYIDGRQCATRIFSQGEGHFTLQNTVFEPDRGEPDPMLDYAKKLLAGVEVSDFPLTTHMFKGRSLELRLREWGIERQDGEDDWALRGRAFLAIFKQRPAFAFELVMGMCQSEMDEMDQILFTILMTDTAHTPAGLQRFVRQYGEDPQPGCEFRAQAARRRAQQ